VIEWVGGWVVMGWGGGGEYGCDTTQVVACTVGGLLAVYVLRWPDPTCVQRPAVDDLRDGSPSVPIKRNHVRANKAVVRSGDLTRKQAAPRARLEVDGSGARCERGDSVVRFENDVFRSVGVGAK
jgi:hypothetical protein